MNLQEVKEKDKCWSEEVELSSAKWFGGEEIGLRYTILDTAIFNRSYSWIPLIEGECLGIYVEMQNVEELEDEIIDAFTSAVCNKANLTHDPSERYVIIECNSSPETFGYNQQCDRSILLIFRFQDK